MTKSARTLFVLTALSLTLMLAVGVSGCFGQRNCQAGIGEGVFWGFLVSAPFWLAALHLTDENLTGRLIRAGCTLVVAIYIYLFGLPVGSLFSIRNVPKIISEIISNGAHVPLAGITIFIGPVLLSVLSFCILLLYVGRDMRDWLTRQSKETA